jgi:hypothetical protein
MNAIYSSSPNAGAYQSWTPIALDVSGFGNADFIAAANPATILGLLDDLEAAEARADSLSGALAHCCCDCGPFEDVDPSVHREDCTYRRAAIDAASARLREREGGE